MILWTWLWSLVLVSPYHVVWCLQSPSHHPLQFLSDSISHAQGNWNPSYLESKSKSGLETRQKSEWSGSIVAGIGQDGPLSVKWNCSIIYIKLLAPLPIKKWTSCHFKSAHFFQPSDSRFQQGSSGICLSRFVVAWRWITLGTMHFSLWEGQAWLHRSPYILYNKFYNTYHNWIEPNHGCGSNESNQINSLHPYCLRPCRPSTECHGDLWRKTWTNPVSWVWCGVPREKKRSWWNTMSRFLASYDLKS